MSTRLDWTLGHGRVRVSAKRETLEVVGSGRASACRRVALVEATLALAARNEAGGVIDDHAKYYRDCARGALGTLVKGSPTRTGGFAHEPLGAQRGLSHDERLRR
jgi:hypothetical protein